MESTRTGLELCSLDVEEVEGFEVDDVKAAAAVHQHLRESSVNDDRVENEWVDTRGDNLFSVVAVVEGDGGA
jgi:hypothetical protein